MKNEYNIKVEEGIMDLRKDLTDIKVHAEAILHAYMRTEAVLPNIIYDLKKCGVLKWINRDNQEV